MTKYIDVSEFKNELTQLLKQLSCSPDVRVVDRSEVNYYDWRCCTKKPTYVVYNKDELVPLFNVELEQYELAKNRRYAPRLLFEWVVPDEWERPTENVLCYDGDHKNLDEYTIVFYQREEQRGRKRVVIAGYIPVCTQDDGDCLDSLFMLHGHMNFKFVADNLELDGLIPIE